MNVHVADEKGNVHNAVTMGDNMAAEFKINLFMPIKVVMTKDHDKRFENIKLGDKFVYNME